MNRTPELETVSPGTLGEVILLPEYATVLAGALYGVNPLDRPGVELGKRSTDGLLGRGGYEAPPARTGDPRWRV